MIATIDTNVLVYSVDHRDAARQRFAQTLINAVKTTGAPIALQVCGEFYRAATRRLGQSPWAAAQAARNLLVSFPVFPATSMSMQRALAEAAAGRFGFWDANLLSAAEMAGCTHLFTEDMQDGARLGSIEIVHAFGPNGISDRARHLLGLAAPR